jgi:hypothetical protein
MKMSKKRFKWFITCYWRDYRNNGFTVEIKVAVEVAGNKYNTIYVINGFINLSLTRMKS